MFTVGALLQALTPAYSFSDSIITTPQVEKTIQSGGLYVFTNEEEYPDVLDITGPQDQNAVSTGLTIFPPKSTNNKFSIQRIFYETNHSNIDLIPSCLQPGCDWKR